MDAFESSCEIGAGGRPGVRTGSRVLRMNDFRWAGVPATEYKQAADHHCGVTRVSLAGEQGETTAFHTRYFEIAPGGFSSFERHQHEHVVVVLRGRGTVRLGDRTHDVGFGDTVCVAPQEPHQFRNAGPEPFGFLCIVDAVRDRPVAVTES